MVAQRCGDTADRVSRQLTRLEVTKVELTTQRTLVAIETTLADSNTETAHMICEPAAAVAYNDDTNSIRVQSKSGKEISAGITGARCLTTP